MTRNSNRIRSPNRTNRNGLIGQGGSLLRTTGTGVILPHPGRLIGRDGPTLRAGAEVTLPEARRAAPPPTTTLAAATAIVTTAAASPTGYTPVPPPSGLEAAADTAAALLAGLPPLPSRPPQRLNLVTPTIQATRDFIENDYLNFYHKTVNTVDEEDLSEEEGLRVATIRAENAKEATTRTAAAAAAAVAAATVVEIMMKDGLEETTETESETRTAAASGLRRNKMCVSAAVDKCGVNDGTINGTIVIRCTKCDELMHGQSCAHTVEGRDDYTCYKPECILKRLELEETNQLVTKEMNWAYAESFKNAKELLTEETIQKKEEEAKQAQEEA